MLKLFFTVFFAEIADKTQLATVMYASQKEHHNGVVFFAASLALIVASAIAVFAGSIMSKWVSDKYVSWIAGIGFVMVGLWILFKGN